MGTGGFLTILIHVLVFCAGYAVRHMTMPKTMPTTKQGLRDLVLSEIHDVAEAAGKDLLSGLAQKVIHGAETPAAPMPATAPQK